jgi:BioD-like phosphotransacetylase family protein
MKTLVIAAVNRESGKTVVALGIALNHPGKVEYIKPIRGNLVKEGKAVYERDAVLVQRILGLEEILADISPIDLDSEKEVDVAALVTRMKTLAEGSDLLLVESGSTAEEGMCQGASSFDLARAMDAPMLLVSDSDPCLLDSVLLLRSYAESHGVTILGVIVNNDRDGKLAKHLEHVGVPVLGNVPFEPALATFRVREILEDVGGECVAGSKGLDRIVEKVVIGAMTAEVALTFMRRIPRKCVITGGDRTDLQLAALTTDTSCLVLTGGMRPNSHVMAEAHEQGVPIIVIQGDTYSVAERFERLEARINPDDEELVGKVQSLIRDNVDLEALF